MSQQMSREITGWDRIISESEEVLAKVEAKAERLRTNIKVAKEAKESGESFSDAATRN